MSNQKPHAIQGILLIPADGDPNNLLAEGPCGARPPMAYAEAELDGEPEPWTFGWLDDWEVMTDELNQFRRALVLAYDGEVIAEGLDRWWRSYGCGRYRHPLEWESEGPASVADIVGRTTAGFDLTLILLDTDSTELGRTR